MGPPPGLDLDIASIGRFDTDPNGKPMSPTNILMPQNPLIHAKNNMDGLIKIES